MSSINFDNPWLLLVAIPAVLLLLVPFFLAVRKDNANVHNVTSCILHVLIAVIMAFSAAGTTIKSVLTETDVYVVADLSYSTNKKLEVIDKYIRNIEKDLPLNTKLGVVCFGATDSQVVHTRLGEKLTSVRESEDKIDNTSTDIVSALDYTSKIFKGGVVKRIVLITDAEQSNMKDGNELKRAVDALYASKIYVDAIYLDSNISESAEEVQISGAEVSDRVYQGQSSSVNVHLQSTIDTQATLEVLRDGELLGKPKRVDVKVGQSNEIIELDTSVVGTFTYTVRLGSIEKDESPFNNEYTFTQTVAQEPSTLFITSNRQDMEAAEKLFSAEVLYVDPADNAINNHIPTSVEELCRYDEIVLSNVDVSDIQGYGMFVSSLDTVVSMLGKSLVGLGDLHLEGNGDEYIMPLAKLLPVEYGEPSKDQIFRVIVLDISNSMETVQSKRKIEVAKDAAKSLVNMMADTDQVAVVGFYGNAQIIQTPTYCDNRDAIKKNIDEFITDTEKDEAASGTSTDHNTVISGGLNAVIERWGEDMKTMTTQVVLITDGMNAGTDWNSSGENRAATAAETLRLEYGALTSILGIYVQTSDKAYLNAVATAGGSGEFVAFENGDELDSSFFKNLSGGGASEDLDNKLALVSKKLLFDDIFEGVEDTKLPNVRGYVLGTGKTGATTVVSLEHRVVDAPSLEVPLYSYWQCGEGKASAFLASFSVENVDLTTSYDNLEQWRTTTVDDNGTTLYEKFFENMFKTNIPVQPVFESFKVNMSRQAGNVQLEIRPAKADATAELTVALTTPDGQRTEVSNLVFDSNLYTCSFVLPSVGAYEVEVNYTHQGMEETLTKTVHLSYLEEYDSFTAYEASPLYKMLSGRGMVSEDGNLKIVNDESEVGVRIVDLTIPLLIAAVSLFMVDIIVRKIKWADIKGLFKKVKKGDKK